MSTLGIPHKNLISTTPTKEPRLRSMALTAAINLSSKKTLDREAYGSHSCGKERKVTQVKIQEASAIDVTIFKNTGS